MANTHISEHMQKKGRGQRTLHMQFSQNHSCTLHAQLLTMAILCKVSRVHSNEMISNHSDHGEGTKVVRQVIQRLVGDHFK
jgi:hypothetical protein